MHHRLVVSALIAALCGTTLAGTATSASATSASGTTASATSASATTTTSAATTASATTAPAAAVDCRRVKCVALTFDDGPVADTQRLLRILRERHVPVTFYLVGKNVQRYPATARAEAEAGHQIGNHSWDHADLTRLSRAAVASEISRTDTAIKQATGKKPTTFRAPYGAQNATVRAAAARPLVHWSVDTLDWKYRDTARLIRVVKRDTRPGDIVLMHDIHRTTVDAVPGIISGLTARGFHFVTVDQLFAPRTLPSGKVTYDNRRAYRP
ncbi:polysaccharide deacetylase family protein [Streptomyces sp. DSM 15324]|uniref:polysaccharide deacetylase family protein n=1 Tax=Streptomyces sp. DSM 15324 TaxID=1739111 RepID=UPI0007486DAC|nr:polysaccharide deacetylase family protein [Streptomyces sp. DSM 15324]KUO06923.1 hydrolase [Streptomyces sp. DSM 15324]